MLRSGPLHVPYVGCGEAVACSLIRHEQRPPTAEPTIALEVTSFNHVHIERMVRSAV